MRPISAAAVTSGLGDLFVMFLVYFVIDELAAQELHRISVLMVCGIGMREWPQNEERVRVELKTLQLKTQGEIEAAVSQGLARFEQEYMGRGPKDIQTHLIGNLLVIRLHGVLTAAEQQLVKTVQPEKGRDLLKQVRTQLIELARPLMEAMVQSATGVSVLSLHHDISTTTGEEIVVFTLTKSPLFRETRQR